MADLKAFRKANKLTQEQVADYLGIKKPFICKIETGREAFPDKHLQKLIDNEFGWDVEMLRKHIERSGDNIVTGNGNAVGNNSVNTATDAKLIAEIAAQRRFAEKIQADSKEQIDRLLSIIEKLSN